MRKLRLGLDLDGVIYRWGDTARYLLKTHQGVDPGDPTYWNAIKDGVPKKAWDWLWTDAVTNHGLFRYGSIYKGSREFLQKLEPICDNVVITSRPANAVMDTMDWLSYQKIPTSEVHILGISQKKSSVLPHCDVYIDDAEHNAADIMADTNAIMVMPDRLYNQQFNPDDFTRFHRTYSWDHIEEILVTLHKQINRES